MGMRLLAVALFALAFSPGCGPDSPTARRELVVFAASSLAEAFAELEARFEAEHPGVDVICQLAGSQALGAQLEHGARADVFASADLEHVEALDRLGLVAETIPFATNELVLAVPRDRPLVTSVESLGDAERIVLGAKNVPVGAYAERFLARSDALYGAGYAEAVRGRTVSREANTRLVLAKVALGEADAAIVYRTDANAASGSVRALAIPAEANVRAEYVLALLAEAREPALGRAFIALLVSPEGRRALEARGFGSS